MLAMIIFEFEKDSDLTVNREFAIEADVGDFSASLLLFRRVRLPSLAHVVSVFFEIAKPENRGQWQKESGSVHAVHENELNSLCAG